MAEINADPIDFAILGDALACWKALERYRDINLECCIPAIVVDDTLDESINARNTHVVKVQPLVNMVSSTGETLQRPVIDATMLRLVSGRYCVDFPINKGDTGWLIASDRDTFTQKSANSNIDTSKNKGAINPNTYELHKYRHGFFIPDSWAKLNLKDFSGSLIIGDIGDDGIPDNYITVNRAKGAIDIVSSNSMSISTKRSVIKSTESTVIDSPKLIVTGDTDIKGKTQTHGIKVIGDAEITGKADVLNGATIRNTLRILSGNKIVDIDPSILPNSMPRMTIRKSKILKDISTKDNKTIITTADAFVLCTSSSEDKEHKIVSEQQGGDGDVVVDNKSINLNSNNQLQLFNWDKDNIISPNNITSFSGEIPYRTSSDDDTELGYLRLIDVIRYIQGLGNPGFNYFTQEFIAGKIIAGRQELNVTMGNPSAGTWYLHIDHPYSGSSNAYISKTQSPNSDTHTCYILFSLSLDTNYNRLYISDDYRSQLCVPLYE